MRRRAAKHELLSSVVRRFPESRGERCFFGHARAPLFVMPKYFERNAIRAQRRVKLAGDAARARRNCFRNARDETQRRMPAQNNTAE
jgi:hypothetical protein